MTNIHVLLFSCLSVVVSGCASTGAPGHGGRDYDVSDLRGVYTFNLVQIRTDDSPPGVTNFCDEQGTVTFNGDGTARGSSTRKCSHTGPVTGELGDFTYTVDPDGAVLIYEVSAPGDDPVRAKMVNRGRMLLFDGTRMREPGKLVFHGVAVKN